MTSLLVGGLDDKVVLVTGAATGIGRETALFLAECGASVFGIGLDAEAAVGLDALGVQFMRCDITDETQVGISVSKVIEHFGRLDGLVNAAAIIESGARLEDVGDAAWQRTIDVNLTGTFRMCRAVLPHLRLAGGGSVVNIASVHAIATTYGVPAYAASKGGVLALTRQIALDYAQDRIRANALLVGSVDTRMTRAALEHAGSADALGLSWDPRKVPRIAAPREIAPVIAFLLSNAASFITASGLTVDGGLTALLL
jgi:NAD(P)-dependent dehydrogenase (short-subunit alcohol dehydrogenase family)